MCIDFSQAPYGSRYYIEYVMIQLRSLIFIFVLEYEKLYLKPELSCITY